MGIALAGLHSARPDTAEPGIWVREDCHGLGIGREAIQAIVAWTSGELLMKRFVYSVAEQNTASGKIAELLGGEVVSRHIRRKYISVTYHKLVTGRTI